MFVVLNLCVFGSNPTVFDASFSYIDEIMRQRSRGHIALVFHHHNITSMDADSIENIVFTKSKVVKILTFYRQSKCVKKAVFVVLLFSNDFSISFHFPEHRLDVQVADRKDRGARDIKEICSEK